jgi:hypothetical protein
LGHCATYHLLLLDFNDQWNRRIDLPEVGGGPSAQMWHGAFYRQSKKVGAEGLNEGRVVFLCRLRRKSLESLFGE